MRRCVANGACLPELFCDLEPVDLYIGPPRPFITLSMKLPVVIATKRNGEFIADLAAQRFGLREFQMMGVARPALADQAGLGCDKQEMGFAAAAEFLPSRRHLGRTVNRRRIELIYRAIN